MVIIFQNWSPRWISPSVAASVCLGSFVLGHAALGCSVSRGAKEVLKLKGQEYVELPAGLCPGYSDALLGKHKSFEYGGVVCDRNEASYIFLQRLVGYTPEKKAIWKVVQIRTLDRLDNARQSIHTNCRHTRKSNHPVFAVVEEPTDSSLKVLKAWRLNLQREKIRPTRRQHVDCQDAASQAWNP